MDSFEDIEAKIKAFESILFRELPNLVKKQALDAVALIQERIQNTGTNAQGSPLGTYSTGYEKKKKEEGKFNGFVDLTDTARMWNSLQLQGEPVVSENVISAIITANTAEDRQKVLDNIFRYGDFLDLTEQERLIIAENIENEILILFNRVFNE